MCDISSLDMHVSASPYDYLYQPVNVLTNGTSRTESARHWLGIADAPAGRPGLVTTTTTSSTVSPDGSVTETTTTTTAPADSQVRLHAAQPLLAVTHSAERDAHCSTASGAAYTPVPQSTL
jgi:hypothetical protein